MPADNNIDWRSRPYVTFTRTGIHVDIERFLRTKAGKESLERVAKAGDRFRSEPSVR
jgi:hypothetical protein